MNRRGTPRDPEPAVHWEGDERMRFALAAARTGVWEWDLDSDRVTWSSTTALALGVSPQQAPPDSRAFFDLVHPDDRAALGDAVEKTLRDRTDLASGFRTIAAGGDVRWIEVHGRLAYDAEGNPRRMLGVNIDVTARKSLENELDRARLEVARLRVLKATMRTVHDIVGNAFTSLQLFREEMEGLASRESLALFDRTVFDAADQLRALGDLDRVAETPMAMGDGIEFKGPPSGSGG